MGLGLSFSLGLGLDLCLGLLLFVFDVVGGFWDFMSLGFWTEWWVVWFVFVSGLFGWLVGLVWFGRLFGDFGLGWDCLFSVVCFVVWFLCLVVVGCLCLVWGLYVTGLFTFDLF